MRLGCWEGGAEGPFPYADILGFSDTGGDYLREDGGGFEIPDAVSEDYVVVWFGVREARG